MKKATINDVAKAAGVSLATVSHVINNTRFVSEKLRKKVSTAIKELNYMPDVHAQNFRTGKKKIIGVIVPYIVNSLFVSIIDQVEQVVSEEGYTVIVCNTKESKEREKEYLKLLASGIADGVVLASTFSEYTDINDVIPDGFPVVLVDRTVKDAPYESVVVSLYDAVYQSIIGLADKGCRKFGYITGIAHLSTNIEGLNAYQDAVKNSKAEWEDNIIQYYNSDYNLDNKSIYECVDKMIAGKVDAILVTNSYVALKVFLFARREKHENW